jgi:hypothetical protein
MGAELWRIQAEEYWHRFVSELPSDAVIQWHIGSTAESCLSCQEMADYGPMAVKDFVAYGVYPQSKDLDCHGYNCRCYLVVVDVPALDLDKTLGELTHGGTIGDPGLAEFYNQVHAEIVAQQTNWAGMTPQSAGKSWFDAPASSAGSFKGTRYGDNTLAAQFETAATPPNWAESPSGGWSKTIAVDFGWSPGGTTMTVPSSAPSQVAEVPTMGELQWLDELTPVLSTSSAPASSAGSFTGERFGD